MPQKIYIKDYDTEVNIPDGADMTQVQAALRRQFPPKNQTGNTPEPKPNWMRSTIETTKKIYPYAQTALAGQAAIPGEGDFSPMASALMRATGSKPMKQLQDLPQNVPEMSMSGRFGPVMGAGVNLARLATEVVAPGTDIAKYIPDKSIGYTVAGFLSPTEQGVALLNKSGASLAAKAANNIIDKGIFKGIRPSSVEINDYRGIKNYYSRAREAVKTILSNRNNLKILNNLGETTNKMPETLNEFSQAIYQTKAQIFKEYDAIAKTAGESGAKVDLKPIYDELDIVAKDRIINKLHPDVAKWAIKKSKALKNLKSLSPEEAQSEIAHVNSVTKAFQKNPNPSMIKQLTAESMYGNVLRKALDKSIESAGPKYQMLKNKYGALKNIEKDVAHRAIIDARKNNKGLIDFSDIGSAAELAKGLIMFDPARVGTAGVIKTVAAMYKHLNNPNTAIKNMFKSLEGNKLLPKITNAAKMGVAQTGNIKAQNDMRDLVLNEQNTNKINQAKNYIKDKINTPSLAYADENTSMLPPAGTPASDIVNTGIESYLASDYKKAIASFMKAIKLDPKRKKQYQQAINTAMLEQAELKRRLNQ